MPIQCIEVSDAERIFLIGAGSALRLRIVLPEGHADVVDFHHPDEEAYGRVTDPERYHAVVDAARVLIDDLISTYEIHPTAGDQGADFPDFGGSAREVIRLQPSEGAPLVFMFTHFPGVFIRAGQWCVEAFPACGCDACDESPVDVIDRLSDLVNAVVGGGYEEELTGRTLSYTLAGAWGSSANEIRLQRGEWKQYGVRGAHQWPGWTER